jgi:hypothetical protein
MPRLPGHHLHAGSRYGSATGASTGGCQQGAATAIGGWTTATTLSKDDTIQRRRRERATGTSSTGTRHQVRPLLWPGRP